MSRSRRKKKKNKRVTNSRAGQYNHFESTSSDSSPCNVGQPSTPAPSSAAGSRGVKDSDGLVTLTSISAPQLRPGEPVPVFVGEPPVYLYSIPQWEARDYISRKLAKPLMSRRRIRGIVITDATDA